MSDPLQEAYEENDELLEQITALRERVKELYSSLAELHSAADLYRRSQRLDGTYSTEASNRLSSELRSAGVIIAAHRTKEQQ